MIKIGDFTLTGGTITALGSLVAVVIFGYNVWSKLDSIENISKRLRAMECYSQIIYCDGPFAEVYSPKAAAMMVEESPAPEIVPLEEPLETEINGDN